MMAGFRWQVAGFGYQELDNTNTYNLTPQTSMYREEWL